MKKLKLKIGNRVWVSLPTNARIIRINKEYGYSLRTDDGAEWSYFDDSEVSLVKAMSDENKQSRSVKQ